MTSRKLTALHGLEWFAVAALTAFYALASRHFFDFTDESIHLYLINEWREASSPAPYFIFFGWFGGILPFDTLYGLRLMTPALLFASCLYTALGLGHYLQSIDPAPQKSAFTRGMAFWPFLAIGSFIYFSIVSALSYDALSAMASYVWIGTVLWILSFTPNQPITHWAIIAANAGALFMAAYSRPSFGMLLILSNLLCAAVIQYATAIRALRPVLIATSLFAVIFGISLYLNRDIVERVISLYPSHAATSHHGVVKKAFTDIFHIFSQYASTAALACFILYGLRRYKPQWFGYALAALVLALGTKILLVLESQSGSALTRRLAIPVILVPCLIMIWQALTTTLTRNWADLDIRRNILLIIACIGIAFICGVGTNSRVEINMMYVAPLMLLPLALLIRRQTALYMALIGLLTVISATYIYKNNYAGYFRNGALALQTHDAGEFPRLRGIKIEPAIADALRTLKTTLESRGFDPQQDKILPWPDLPGFLSALDYRAFGNAWFYTAYEDMYKVNCAYIALEPVGPVRDVYVITDGKMDPPFERCAFAVLKPVNDRMISVPLGTINHYRNGNMVDLTLVGPYRFEKPDTQARQGLQENNAGE